MLRSDNAPEFSRSLLSLSPVHVRSRYYHPVFYWAVVVATTTVGTTTSDYFDRTLDLGYVKFSVLLLCAVIGVLVVWRRVTGAIAVDHITNRMDETFYWLTIVSSTLGRAVGDLVATSTGLGFERGALVFAGQISLVALALDQNRGPPAPLGRLRSHAAPRGDARRYTHKAA